MSAGLSGQGHVLCAVTDAGHCHLPAELRGTRHGPMAGLRLCGRGELSVKACGSPLGSAPVSAAPRVASQPGSCRGYRRIPLTDLVAKALNNESCCMGMTVLRVLACSGNAFS